MIEKAWYLSKLLVDYILLNNSQHGVQMNMYCFDVILFQIQNPLVHGALCEVKDFSCLLNQVHLKLPNK